LTARLTAGGVDVKDALYIGALRLLPKNLWSRAVGAAAYAPLPKALANMSVRAFARLYDIEVEEAERPIGDYPSLGAFFVRRLRLGARPVDRRPGVGVSPADGRVLNFGYVQDATLIQAKGRHYRLEELLADTADAERFRNGAWVTVYLSPRDYHRVHHPVEGEVHRARHVPGHLWPVNRVAVENVDDLFCVNERLITYVRGAAGEVATIMVGATSVGHITAAYDDALRTNRGGAGSARDYSPSIPVSRGDELGTFHLGSTAIVLFAQGDLEFEALTPGMPIRMGQAIVRRRSQK
jgi:phosphatidylserine decarboxylase